METPCCADLLSHIQEHLYSGALAKLSRASKAYHAEVRSTLSCRRMVHIWARMRMKQVVDQIQIFTYSESLRQRLAAAQMQMAAAPIPSSFYSEVVTEYPYVDACMDEDFRSLGNLVRRDFRSLGNLYRREFIRREETALNRRMRKAKSRGLKK